MYIGELNVSQLVIFNWYSLVLGVIMSKQIKVTLILGDARDLEQLSANTGLSKSSLVQLMIRGTLRDIEKDPYQHGSSSLIMAWCSKTKDAVLEYIEVG